jgi:hypothetical protein
MPRVIREDVATPYGECNICKRATPYGECNICKRPTRSHVLEPAIYDEFTTEEVIGRADDYASKQWEEVEEVVKYRLAKKAIVLCHGCFVEQERKLTAMVDKNYVQVLQVRRGSGDEDKVPSKGIEGV